MPGSLMTACWQDGAVSACCCADCGGPSIGSAACSNRSKALSFSLFAFRSQWQNRHRPAGGGWQYYCANGCLSILG